MRSVMGGDDGGGGSWRGGFGVQNCVLIPTQKNHFFESECQLKKYEHDFCSADRFLVKQNKIAM